MKKIILLLFLISIPFAQALESGKAYIVSSINVNSNKEIESGQSYSLVPQIVVATGSENYAGSVTPFTGCYGGKRYEGGEEKGNCLTGVVNSLNSDSETDALSAAQGKVLNDRTRINLLNPTLKTQTTYGITVINNNDGTYTLNGTAERDYEFILKSIKLKKGKYRLIGCPAGGASNVYGVYYHELLWETLYAGDFGNGDTFTIDSDMDNNKTYVVTIYVEKGTTINNLTFKPMLTNDLSATYNDFVSFDDSLITGANSGLKLDLLWENTNPSASFPAQSINVDFSNYSCLLIKFSNPLTQSIMINSTNYGLDVGNYNFTKGYTVTRNVTIKNYNEIYFGGGSYQFSFGSDTKNDSYLIPHLIYGIK